jgi:SAM-dependent methyltransferase
VSGTASLQRTSTDVLARPENFVEIERCMLCGGAERDERFRDDGFRVVGCRGCGLVYVTPRLRPDVLPAVYDEGYWSSDAPKDRGYADYRLAAPLYLRTFRRRYRLLRRWLGERLGEPGRALDVGCAAGFFLTVLRENGWDASGVELSPAIARQAIEVHGEARVFVGDLASAPWPEQSFDLITMWDVVEHVPEPLPFLERARALLRPGGRLVLETQNVASRFARLLGRKWQHYKHLEHLYHFDPRTIEKLLARAGLALEHRTAKGGGKYVSVGFVRERATRVSKALRWLLLPLEPLDGLALYVNLGDEMIVVARKA